MADFLGVGTLQNEVISQNTNRALGVGTLRNEMISQSTNRALGVCTLKEVFIVSFFFVSFHKVP